jgi:hypothetical protein
MVLQFGHNSDMVLVLDLCTLFSYFDTGHSYCGSFAAYSAVGLGSVRPMVQNSHSWRLGIVRGQSSWLLCRIMRQQTCTGPSITYKRVIWNRSLGLGGEGPHMKNAGVA